VDNGDDDVQLIIHHHHHLNNCWKEDCGGRRSGKVREHTSLLLAVPFYSVTLQKGEVGVVVWWEYCMCVVCIVFAMLCGVCV
jgi:hypothetical protein